MNNMSFWFSKKFVSSLFYLITVVRCETHDEAHE